MNAVERISADNFLGDGLQVIVERHHMVAIPAHAAADVQENLIQVEQDGGDFIGDSFGGVEMPGIEG